MSAVPGESVLNSAGDVNSTVRWAAVSGVAMIVIDNPPVNAAAHSVRAGLMAAISEAEAEPSVEAIVIAAEGRTFVAGADIREFDAPPREPHLPDVCARIEACNKPVVAALHGTTLGGGCEIALACHGRIIDAKGSLGLPEVKLGLVPGAGGTQRLPRLVGIPAAIDIIASGRIVPAKEALALGLVDAIADGDLRTAAIALVRSLIGAPIKRSLERTVAAFDPAAVDAQIRDVERKARGQSSLKHAARLVRLSADTPAPEALAQERATFLKLKASDQSAALRHVFFAEREASRRPELEGVAPRAVRKVGIIGAGTMGSGIAVAFLDAGYPVTVIEGSDAQLEAGRGRIDGLYQRALVSGRLNEEAKAERLTRASFSVDIADLNDADLIVEAVYEEMGVKQDLMRLLGTVARADAILATNTSYLDVNVIAEAAPRPENVLGLHFFSPAHVMKLMEIVRGDRTSAETLATGIEVAKRLKKIAVTCGVCDGFIGNRILSRYRAQCEFMLEEGALPHEIDAALEAFGLPMGPFAVQDLSGLDISWARRKRLAATRDPAERYVAIADRLCEAGRFGQKTGAGWYRYENGKRQPDPSVAELVLAASAEKGIARREIAPEEIVSRVRAAMVNEGAKILDEGIAARASDIDLVMIHGYGFPAWRGGPMFEASRTGYGALLDEAKHAHARDGKGWEPARLLADWAASPPN